MNHDTYRYSIAFLLLVLCLLASGFSDPFSIRAYGNPLSFQESSDSGLSGRYREYRRRFESTETMAGIDDNGFEMIEPKVLDMEIKGIGQVSVTLTFDTEYDCLAAFISDEDGRIVYETDQLETNNQHRGSPRQLNERLSAASSRGVNGDGLTDIALISSCFYDSQINAGKSYKVGDVLFQKDGSFYRDYRISDKINRFGMNKSISFLTSFVRNGYSTEFLYTSNTQQELVDSGFQIVPTHYYPVVFEKLGRLWLVPRTCRMAEYVVFMLYLVNEQGYIVWSLQPMGDYEDLYGLRGINCRDIDGDGLKDIVVLASYSYEGKDGEIVVETDYSVYHQRTSGFYEDADIKHTVQCSDSDTIYELVERLWAYWGWRSEQ